MSSRFPEALLLVVAALAWPALACAAAPPTQMIKTLRVCAHPDNLPFSAQDESGFDNRIARVLADELHATLEYTWLQPQHGLVRKTIGAGLCDAILGLPQGYEGVATTAPYYRSRYVFITPRDARLTPSFDDAAFLAQRIGVQLIGDDMAATPPGHVLARAHASHVVGFPVYGAKPAVARMVDAIADHSLDAGVAWGPAAGYFAARASVPLTITPAPAPAALHLPFAFAVVIAVRKDDGTLRVALDRAIERRRSDIDAILRAYHVPRADAPVHASLSPCAASLRC